MIQYDVFVIGFYCCTESLQSLTYYVAVRFSAQCPQAISSCNGLDENQQNDISRHHRNQFYS